MSSESFEEWAKEIDQNFGAQKRKIGLIIHNCPVHPAVPALDWVELIFLPPNTTSITQPMDQVIIRSHNAKYCSLAVKKQIDAAGKGNQLPKFSILAAMSILSKAWNSTPDRTSMTCFKKSRISKKSIEKALNEEGFFASLNVGEDVMESLRDDLEMLKKKSHENNGMTAVELVDSDFEITVTSTASDADIIAEVSGHVDIDYEEESDGEEQPTGISKPAFKDVMNAITVLEDYSLFSNFEADLMKTLKDANRAFDLDCLCNKKRSTITDFFQTL